MNVKTLCLSILYENEATGYEIRQLSTNGECSYFVEASYGSIYPALTKLEQEGLLTSHTQVQQGRPAKKIYKITQAGRDEFRTSLTKELNEDIFRSEFLLFARFASILPKALVKKRLQERKIILEQEIANLTAMQNQGNKNSNEWVLNYGLNIRNVEIQYLKAHMNKLIDIASADVQLATTE
jgi:DNA-binding PadR family transcriptional regulator